MWLGILTQFLLSLNGYNPAQVNFSRSRFFLRRWEIKNPNRTLIFPSTLSTPALDLASLFTGAEISPGHTAIILENSTCIFKRNSELQRHISIFERRDWSRMRPKYFASNERGTPSLPALRMSHLLRHVFHPIICLSINTSSGPFSSSQSLKDIT